MSDYITYTWVKDDAVAFNEEIIQVGTSAPSSLRRSVKEMVHRWDVCAL